METKNIKAFGAEAEGTKRIERIQENIGSIEVSFTHVEITGIRDKLNSITIVGGRYPEEQEKLTGL